LPFASVSSLASLKSNFLHLPAITVWAFPFCFYLLAYFQNFSYLPMLQPF
jgi:hypothetical protein